VSAAHLLSEYVLVRTPEEIALSNPDRTPLFMSVITPVIMSVLDQYPGARAKMCEALEQLRLSLPDPGGSAASTPGDG
jgi:hypothetical protein